MSTKTHNNSILKIRQPFMARSTK